MNSGWVAATYLIYAILFVGIVIGGCGYAVFVRGHSGWWFLLALLLLTAMETPGDWAVLAGKLA